MELMVDLPLVERESVGIVDPDLLRPNSVCIVALTTQELHSPGIGCLDLLEQWAGHAAWKPNCRTVLCAAILGICTSHRIFGCSIEEILCKVTNLVLGQCHTDHLCVAELAIIWCKGQVMVADAALVPSLHSTCVPSKCSDFIPFASQSRNLLLDDLMLHVPEAALPEEHVDTCSLSPRSARRTSCNGSGHSRGHEEPAGPVCQRLCPGLPGGFQWRNGATQLHQFGGGCSGSN
mmetsp:Transcript_121565/g.339271  ORF Transcript_121565/g.339271 Transcript_121565/m.339271 type:complete len:234 (-) Transcript_121565:169-870(-)